MKDVTDQYTLSKDLARDYTLRSVHETVTGPLCVQYGRVGADYVGVIGDPGNSLHIAGTLHHLAKRRTLDTITQEMGLDVIGHGRCVTESGFSVCGDRKVWIRFFHSGVEHYLLAHSEEELATAVDKIRAGDK